MDTYLRTYTHTYHHIMSKNVAKKESKRESKKEAADKKDAKDRRKRRVNDSSSDDDSDDDDEEIVWETDDDDSDDDDDDDESDASEVRTKKHKKHSHDKKSKSKSRSKSKSSRKVVESNDSDDSEDSDDDSDDDSEDSEEDDKKGSKKKKQPASQFNIVFSGMGGGGGSGISYGNEMDSDELEEILGEDEDDDDAYATDEDERTFMKETYEHIVVPLPVVSEDSDRHKKKNRCSVKGKAKAKTEIVADAEIEPGAGHEVGPEVEYQELIGLKKHVSEKLQHNPNSKLLQKTLKECKKSIQDLVKHTRMQNTKEYYKLITADQNQPSEFSYFKKKLSHTEQKYLVKQIAEINQHLSSDVPHRITLLQSTIPAKYKAIVMNKLNMLQYMEPGDSEYSKLKNWVDTFMRIPIDIYKEVSVSYTRDGAKACEMYMRNAKKVLDDCVYGHDNAKMQIMQVIGQWITNPSAMGTAIAIKGPPGTGKSSLVKDGISKILGREFALIALGGTGDASFLEGHSYTYEGSSWGKIVQILIDGKCMNPVIYFDELDKVSDTARGQEIIGVLTHMTDTTQNNQFHDKYFSEVDFDVSKCLFIFSYNDEALVSPILRDRMYCIETAGYDVAQKVVIAKQYLLPKIRAQVNFQEGDVVISDEVLRYIISNERITQKEDGVRNLKRCLEIIHTKLNLYRLICPATTIEEDATTIKAMKTSMETDKATATDKATEKTTDKATDKTTDKTTDKATDNTTDKATTKATTKATDKATDKATEKATTKESGNTFLGKDMPLNVSFPYTVTAKDVDILIKHEEKQNQSLLAMYI